jgi:hypothetical protein
MRLCMVVLLSVVGTCYGVHPLLEEQPYGEFCEIIKSKKVASIKQALHIDPNYAGYSDEYIATLLKHNFSSLEFAVSFNNIRLVEEGLAQNSKLLDTPIEGRYPLVSARSIAMIELLRGKGAHLTKHTDEKRNTILHKVTMEGRTTLAWYLLKNFPALAEAWNSQGFLPVHYVASKKMARVYAQDLIALRTPYAIEPRDTLLHGLVMHYRNGKQKRALPIIKYLSKKFPELLTLENTNGETPIDYCIKEIGTSDDGRRLAPAERLFNYLSLMQSRRN